MNGSRVEEGAQLENCILSPGAVVSANVSAANVILGDDERLKND
jgi:ADP-glucose pyrophosphorylase